MNFAPTSPLWTTMPLPAAAPVQRLHLRAGRSLWLQALTGTVWLTCEGQISDCFLQPGESLRLDGPARLYLGAQGTQAASLRWCHASTTAPSALPQPAASTPPAGKPALHPA